MRIRILYWFARFYTWLAERLYNQLAFIYDPVSWLVSFGHWHAVRLWALEYVREGRVLEIGFGTGELLLEMSRRSLDAYGLEFSPAMHRQTSRKLRKRQLSIPRLRAASQCMPFASGSFATILSTYPAGYILDPGTLKEAARVLQPGGKLVVVGLFVTSQHPLFRPIVALLGGGQVAGLLEHFQRLGESCGFRVKIIMRQHGIVEVPVIQVEKCQ